MRPWHLVWEHVYSGEDAKFQIERAGSWSMEDSSESYSLYTQTLDRGVPKFGNIGKVYMRELIMGCETETTFSA